MQIIVKKIIVTFIVIFILPLSGCGKASSRSVESARTQSPFASFRNIPGITAEEIAAIEALQQAVLQKQNRSLEFGVALSAESFIKYTDDEYAVGGYIARYCDWLTALFDIRFRPEIYVLSEMIDKLTSAEIDFGILRVSEERRKTYFMTDAIAERMIIMLRIEGSENLDRISMTRLPRYAFLQGSSTYDMVSATLESGTYEAVFAADYDTGYTMLKNEEADALLDANIAEAAFEQYTDVYSVDFMPLLFYSVAMTTANPALRPIISIITKAQRNGTMPYLAHLYNEGNRDYRKHKLSLLLNNEEREYLQNSSSVPLAFQYFNYPIAFFNPYEKEWQGFALDMLKEVERLTGLTFKIVNDENTPWPVLLEMLADGRAHILPDVVYSPDRADQFIWPKNMFMTDQYALLSKWKFPNLSSNEIAHARIGLIKNTAHAELFRTWFPDAYYVTEYNTAYDAFLAMDNDEVDMVMASRGKVIALTNYYEFSDYKTNIIFNSSYGSTFGFNKDQTTLCSIVDKALTMIDMAAIVGQWETRTYDYRAKMAEARLPWLIGAAILSLVTLTLILTMFYRGRNLRKQKEAEIKIREADERAKIMLDSTPLACTMIAAIDGNYSVIDCNKEALKLFGVSTKQEYVERFFEFWPERQSDGQKSSEKAPLIFRKVFDEGYAQFEWLHMIGSELMPAEVTLVRVEYGDDNVLAGYTRDLRAVKEAEAKVREADERIRAMFDAMPLCSNIWNRDGTMSDVNEEILRLFDLKDRREFIEKFDDLSPEYQPDGRPSAETATSLIAKAYKDGYCRFEWMMQKLNGEPIPVEVFLIRIKHLDDYIVVTYFRDLRELKDSIAKMREADERALLMIENTPLTVMVWNKDIQILDCNQEAVKTFGLSSKQEYMERFIELAPEYQSNGMTSWEMIQKEIAKVFQTGSASFEWTHHHGVTGEVIPFQITWIRVKYKGEDTAVSYAQDLRELRDSIAKMREADERAQILFDTAPLASCMFDKDGHIISFNQETVKMFGFPDKEYFYNIHKELTPEYQPDGTLSSDMAAIYSRLAVEKGYHRFEWMHQKLSGEPLPAEITLVHIRYRDEDAIAGYIRDLTEQKAMVQLAKQQAEAEAASRAKSSFLATMSHEIRTPMNAILGVAEIQLQNNGLSPETKNALNIIYNSGYTLLGIINDLLDLSKIEAGKLELLNVRYETASMINDTINLNTAHIGNKPIEFKLYVDEDLPFELIGDELRVKQIFNNLLSNAFKYTDSGEVSLSFSAKINDGENVTLTFTVRDTGQGMTEEQLQTLFDVYSRFNLKANRIVEGTGLGMSIVQQLVNKMGGNVSVDSVPGKGTEVTVHLIQGYAGPARLGGELAENLMKFRLSNISKAKKAQIVREPMPYGSVLVVDDMETNLYVARGFLLSYGLTIDTALSGPEAIEKIERGSEYDIVFMDHMMPEMDGIEAVQIMRKKGYTRPIIALTANAVSGQADIFMANGFDGFISKPIDIRELNASLNKFVRDQYPPEVVEAARAAYGGGDISDKDKTYLDKVLLTVKEACAVYDTKTARDALTELKQKMWPGRYSELLDTIAGHLLHSDFDEAEAACAAYLSDKRGKRG